MRDEYHQGFLAVSLFTVVPVRLYALSVSLQGTFSAGLTGYGRSIGEVGQDIITELSEIQTLSDVVNSSHFGLGIITSPIMLLFCVILMGYAVLKVFFANLKRGGILLIRSRWAAFICSASHGAIWTALWAGCGRSSVCA